MRFYFRIFARKDFFFRLYDEQNAHRKKWILSELYLLAQLIHVRNEAQRRHAPMGKKAWRGKAPSAFLAIDAYLWVLYFTYTMMIGYCCCEI